MNCDDVRQDDVVERYLLNRLEESEREAFERHFFECDACLEELDSHRALQAELRRVGVSGTRRWLVWASAAAALGAVGFVSWWTLRPFPTGGAGTSPNTEQTGPSTAIPLTVASPAPPPGVDREAFLAELGRVTPPIYERVVLRETPSEARTLFRDAMKRYVEGEFASAIPGLRAALDLEPGAPDIAFFLATCYLLTGQTDTAIESLRRTIALGDTPYLEEARLLLARAHARTGDLRAAEEELRAVTMLNGDMRAQAAALLDRIEDLERSR